MKKIILPLLVLVAASAFSSNGNASENLSATDLLTQIRRIHCDFRGSQVSYNLRSKKYIFSGRTTDDVYPILDARADDEKNTIIITKEQSGRVSEDVFKIKGKPFKVGFDDVTRVSVELRNADCMGYL